MAFRSSEYLQRNELVRFQLEDVIRAPANDQRQTKNGFKFTINDSSYCVKQKKVTQCVPGCEGYVRAKNGRIMLKCTCAECGITKTKFVNQRGS